MKISLTCCYHSQRVFFIIYENEYNKEVNDYGLY